MAVGERGLAGCTDEGAGVGGVKSAPAAFTHALEALTLHTLLPLRVVVPPMLQEPVTALFSTIAPELLPPMFSDPL